ncbi:hypothetical protein F66182_4403 [Fusarium sp. NRRL 66182]|nr:hypothetical protein F66182_4403 [Fusarium sp. NRRL 66182]
MRLAVLPILAVLLPSTIAQCVVRSRRCSPQEVCDRLSNGEVCGSSERATDCGPVVAFSDGSGGTKTCTCCPR